MTCSTVLHRASLCVRCKLNTERVLDSVLLTNVGVRAILLRELQVLNSNVSIDILIGQSRDCAELLNDRSSLTCIGDACRGEVLDSESSRIWLTGNLRSINSYAYLLATLQSVLAWLGELQTETVSTIEALNISCAVILASSDGICSGIEVVLVVRIITIADNDTLYIECVVVLVRCVDNRTVRIQLRAQGLPSDSLWSSHETLLEEHRTLRQRLTTLNLVRERYDEVCLTTSSSSILRNRVLDLAILDREIGEEVLLLRDILSLNNEAVNECCKVGSDVDSTILNSIREYQDIIDRDIWSLICLGDLGNTINGNTLSIGHRERNVSLTLLGALEACSIELYITLLLLCCRNEHCIGDPRLNTLIKGNIECQRLGDVRAVVKTMLVSKVRYRNLRCGERNLRVCNTRLLEDRDLANLTSGIELENEFTRHTRILGTLYADKTNALARGVADSSPVSLLVLNEPLAIVIDTNSGLCACISHADTLGVKSQLWIRLHKLLLTRRGEEYGSKSYNQTYDISKLFHFQIKLLVYRLVKFVVLWVRQCTLRE